jgi:hypothetical protein
MPVYNNWIKMRKELPDDPAVILIARETGLSEDAVVGKLLRIWSWVDTNSTDGVIVNCDSTWIDHHVRAPGFAEAMKRSSWLDARNGNLIFVNYERHNGETAKKRAVNLACQKTYREKRSSQSCHENVRANYDKTLTREEQRRTEQRQREESSERPADQHLPEKVPEGTAEAVELNPAAAVLKRQKGKRNVSNDAHTAWEVADILAKRGCDESFRGVYRAITPIELARALANEYDQIKSNIKKPGAWWRRKLNKAGVSI